MRDGMTMTDTNERTKWAEFGSYIRSARDAREWSRSETVEHSGRRFSISWLQTLEDGGRTYRGEWQLPPPPEQRKLRALIRTLGLDEEVVRRYTGRDMGGVVMTGESSSSSEDLGELRHVVEELRSTVEALLLEVAELKRRLPPDTGPGVSRAQP